MYRSPPTAGPVCDLHPAAPAAATCATCDKRICVPCTLHDGLSTVCPGCARATRRRTRARFVGTRAALAITIGGAYLACAHAIKERRDNPMLWGEATPEVRALLAAQAAQPCDTAGLLRLGEKLFEVGDVRGALGHIDHARATCGTLPDEVNVLSFQLHRRARDVAGAVRDLDRRIELDPGSAARRLERAHALLAAGEPQAAIFDYVAALRCVDAEPRRVLSELEDVYAQLGHQAVVTTLAHAKMFARYSRTDALANRDEAEARLVAELAKLPPELDELKRPGFVRALGEAREPTVAER